MSEEKEVGFTPEFWRRLKEYLEKYLVGGIKLDAKYQEPVYSGKIPDIVILDEKEIPQLIIETKRKAEGKYEDIYDPLGRAPIAQALCYAALALERHKMDRTPLFATANKSVIIIFRGVERRELENLLDIELCHEKHTSPEDWAKALKPGAHDKLVQEYIIDRLEKPLSESTIKRLFGYVENWIINVPITPPQLYRILIEQLRQHIEELHDEHVEDAVKARILDDPEYFGKLYEQAKKQGYRKGILSSGLLSLCAHEERSIRERICDPLADELRRRISGRTPQEKFSSLREIANKDVKELVGYCREAGEKSPSICDRKIGEVLSFRNLSRMMTYVLGAKILAYKVLEMHYNIPPLEFLDDSIEVDGEKIEIRDPNDITEALNRIFATASKRLEESIKIRDFRPLFETGLYDMIVFEGLGAIKKVKALIEVADAIKESLRHLPGIIGYVYEGFIPPSERHQLGQFYTPPAVARLITRWSIRSGDDRVLDGGCGSGTFLIEAYKRLLFLKYNKNYDEHHYPSCKDYNEHQEILNRLYGVDINAFATQLTSLHLMFMEPRCPFSQLNVSPMDFFSLASENLENVNFFDAVIGNPPYTRWVEIPDETKNLIKKVWDLALDYDLAPDLRRGIEPGIYTYWIIHATKSLLKSGGRLGMIISNMWLQTDYGTGFGRFLLDHLKVKALIDISYRLFDALISTVIVLGERELDEKARSDNEVLLVRIPPIDRSLSDKDVERRLDEALRCIENSITPNYEFDKTVLEKCRCQHGIWYRFVKQSEIPRDKKWISLFFGDVEDIVRTLEKSPLMIRGHEWFKPSYGNALYLCLSSWGKVRGVRNLGSRDFFYFSRSKIEEWERKVEGFSNAVRQYLVPAITASRYVRTFKFTPKDWKKIRDKVVREEKERKIYANAYILVAHKKGEEKLPQQLQEYIRWGETECKTRIRGTRGGGRICSEAEACKAREKAGKVFFSGWYDLGGYIPTPIMAIRQAGYHPQFFLATAPFITYDAIITFIPKVRIKVDHCIYDPMEYNKIYHNIIDVNSSIELDEAEIKALLAYLNSTFAWIWLEQTGRRTGGGILALEADISEKMPMLNVKKINRKDVEELAELFDELEFKARQFTGTSLDTASEEEGEEGGKLEMFRKLRPIFKKIDSKIAEILGITVDVDALWDSAWDMMERRVKGAGRRVRPGAEVEIDIEERDRRSRRSSPPDNVVPLTEWLEPEGRNETKSDTANN
jgi:type I restriction-modification system DNA methylase subunit